LFIYGGVGLGKTHLMNAIGNYISSRNNRLNVLLMTSETMTNELIEGIARKKTSELRNRLRNVDVLMVDDIQFLSRTKATQEEFFHTFNSLHDNKKQIIIASDRPPKELPEIEERLRSRFEWGLIVDIQKPDYETRVAILMQKANDMSIDVPYDVVEYIAQNVNSNIRELEGCLTSLNAYAAFRNEPITLEMAQAVLSDRIRAHAPRNITPELIIEVVAGQYSLTAEDITGSKRSPVQAGNVQITHPDLGIGGNAALDHVSRGIVTLVGGQALDLTLGIKVHNVALSGDVTVDRSLVVAPQIEERRLALGIEVVVQNHTVGALGQLTDGGGAVVGVDHLIGRHTVEGHGSLSIGRAVSKAHRVVGVVAGIVGNRIGPAVGIVGMGIHHGQGAVSIGYQLVVHTQLLGRGAAELGGRERKHLAGYSTGIHVALAVLDIGGRGQLGAHRQGDLVTQGIAAALGRHQHPGGGLGSQGTVGHSQGRCVQQFGCQFGSFHGQCSCGQTGQQHAQDEKPAHDLAFHLVYLRFI
jgi:hypothetical protein